MQRLQTAILVLFAAMTLTSAAMAAGSADGFTRHQRPIPVAMRYVDDSLDNGPTGPGPTDPNGPPR
jgi:hypothetical protein